MEPENHWVAKENRQIVLQRFIVRFHVGLLWGLGGLKYHYSGFRVDGTDLKMLSIHGGSCKPPFGLCAIYS